MPQSVIRIDTNAQFIHHGTKRFIKYDLELSGPQFLLQKFLRNDYQLVLNISSTYLRILKVGEEWKCWYWSNQHREYHWEPHLDGFLEATDDDDDEVVKVPAQTSD